MTEAADKPIMKASILIGALVLIGAVGQFAAGFAPDILGWSETIASRSAQTRVLLIPGGGAFLIWLPLFVGSIAFAIYALFPAQLRNPDFRRVTSLAGAAYWANTGFSLHSPLFGPTWVGFMLLLGILIPLLAAAMVAMRARFRSKGQRLAVAPVFGQAGWISVATAAGLTQTARFEEFNPLGLDALSIALVTLLIFAGVLFTLAWRLKSWVYAGAAAWGLSWIALVNWDRELVSLSLVASIFALALLAITFWGRQAKGVTHVDAQAREPTDCASA